MAQRRTKGGDLSAADARKKSSAAQAARPRAERKAADGGSGDEDATPHVSRSLWREYFESAVVTAVMALFFMTFVGQAATVPTASMQNTILVGDHFLINKFIFASGPHAPFLPQRDIRRGDIIVFKYPSDIDTNEQVVRYQTYYIKRVIAMPGDTVEVRGPQVLINGKALPEHRLAARMPGEERNRPDPKAPLDILNEPPRQAEELHYNVYYRPETLNAPPEGDYTDFFKFAVNGKPLAVPEGHYFVMGDNRDNSSDSRRWGLVPRHLVVGRAMFVIWSYDESAPPSGGGFIVDFFKNSRWGRTGTLIK